MRGSGSRCFSFLVAAILAATTSLPQRAQAEDLDIKQVFRCTAPDASGQAACDRAREMVLFNCTVCHVFVRIVRKQSDAAEWDGTLARHRERVHQLSDAQFKEIRDYLVANFRPDLPPPVLPDYLATQF